MIDAILTNTVLPQISREFLQRLSQANATTEIAIGVVSGDLNYQFG
jgi:type VI secretion system protein VasG